VGAKDVAWVCEAPEVVRCERGVPHATDGPAIRWRDGTAIFACDGVPVPGELVLAGPEDLLAMDLQDMPNQTARRLFIQKYGGLMRVGREIGRTLDRDGDYELIDIPMHHGRHGSPHLVMHNPSVPGAMHVEGVHPTCTTVREALAWRNGTDAPPTVLT
jgi:hypothetical protein